MPEYTNSDLYALMPVWEETFGDGLRIGSLAGPELVKIVGPSLHHSVSLGQVGATIGRLDRVPDHMRQRSLRHIAGVVRPSRRPIGKAQCQ